MQTYIILTIVGDKMDIEGVYNLFKTLLPYANQVLEPTNPFLKNMDELQSIISIIDNMGGINNLIKKFGIQNTSTIGSQTTKQNESEIEKYQKIIDLE